MANIALTVLDEQLMAPWKPGGEQGTVYRRAARRGKGLPTWRLVRYADDFVVLVHGTQTHVEALREDVARVLVGGMTGLCEPRVGRGRVTQPT